SAPGSAVRSATRSSDTAYSSSSGTSMATPHVVGVAALVMEANPNLKGNPRAVEALLRETATTDGILNQSSANAPTECGGTLVTSWPIHLIGHGRLDAFAAFKKAEKIMANSFDDQNPQGN